MESNADVGDGTAPAATNRTASLPKLLNVDNTAASRVVDVGASRRRQQKQRGLLQLVRDFLRHEGFHDSCDCLDAEQRSHQPSTTTSNAMQTTSTSMLVQQRVQRQLLGAFDNGDWVRFESVWGRNVSDALASGAQSSSSAAAAVAASPSALTAAAAGQSRVRLRLRFKLAVYFATYHLREHPSSGNPAIAAAAGGGGGGAASTQDSDGSTSTTAMDRFLSLIHI